MTELEPFLEWITVCRRCGHADRPTLRPTIGTACGACGGYGWLAIREAVVVASPVPPAERYAWTPYLERRADAL